MRSPAPTTTTGMNVRRLAAIDMHGTRGTTRRRRIVQAEFGIGAVAMVAFGSWLIAATPRLGGRAVGVWAIGAGLNYVPLAIYAFTLNRPGALDRELDGVDPALELRRYGRLQIWIFVPLSLVIFALRYGIAHDVRRTQHQPLQPRQAPDDKTPAP